MEILKERKFSVHVQNVVIFVGLEGIDVAQAEGVYDGPNEDAKKFYNLVEEASQELHPGLLTRRKEIKEIKTKREE
ncbi:hypothetical protein KY290_010855 [Solanum tuberosum]|uniref:Uncharacterized protein n=1 Tax=Solanum tuberosum TaxID=4113 RepID=A0ABQ7VYZ1_SOLTU|nr:hypothetical protein KY290_010855 [Solanum tuberosum]